MQDNFNLDKAIHDTFHHFKLQSIHIHCLVSSYSALTAWAILSYPGQQSDCNELVYYLNSCG